MPERWIDQIGSNNLRHVGQLELGVFDTFGKHTTNKWCRLLYELAKQNPNLQILNIDFSSDELGNFGQGCHKRHMVRDNLPCWNHFIDAGWDTDLLEVLAYLRTVEVFKLTGPCAKVWPDLLSSWAMAKVYKMRSWENEKIFGRRIDS